MPNQPSSGSKARKTCLRCGQANFGLESLCPSCRDLVFRAGRSLIPGADLTKGFPHGSANLVRQPRPEVVKFFRANWAQLSLGAIFRAVLFLVSLGLVLQLIFLRNPEDINYYTNLIYQGVGATLGLIFLLVAFASFFDPVATELNFRTGTYKMSRVFALPLRGRLDRFPYVVLLEHLHTFDHGEPNRGRGLLLAGPHRREAEQYQSKKTVPTWSRSDYQSYLELLAWRPQQEQQELELFAQLLAGKLNLKLEHAVHAEHTSSEPSKPASKRPSAMDPWSQEMHEKQVRRIMGLDGPD